MRQKIQVQKNSYLFLSFDTALGCVLLYFVENNVERFASACFRRDRVRFRRSVFFRNFVRFRNDRYKESFVADKDRETEERKRREKRLTIFSFFYIMISLKAE